MNRTAARLWCCAATLSLIAGCAGDSDETQEVAALSAPPIVDFEATDFAFSGPDTIAPGITTLRLTNNGRAFHHLTVVKLAEGHDLAEFTSTMAEEGHTPDWAILQGGPNPAAGGMTIQATMELTPGTYGILCLVPEAGTPHYQMGMLGGFEVAGEEVPVDYQAPAITMTLDDYNFNWSEMPTGGVTRVRVENAGPQAHELVVMALNEGVTNDDLLEWLHAFEQGTAGPPPFSSLTGGTSAMAPGTTNDIELNLESGTYAMLCFVPDSGDGNPHFLHGMIDQFTIN